MKDSCTKTAALAMTVALAGSAICIEASAGPATLPTELTTPVRPPKPAMFHPPKHVVPAIPQPEPNVATTPNAGFATSSAFSSTSSVSATSSQTLTGPVTLSYSGASNAFQLTDSGTGRGLSASITNKNNVDSALYGDTVGAGAGLTGYNLGTVGPGGKFEVTNSASAQAGAFATTSGTGPAVFATITNSHSNSPAVYGQTTSSQALIPGVEGDSNYLGVEGFVPATTTVGGTGEFSSAAVLGINNSTGWGVEGLSSGDGSAVGGYADAGYGVYASSNSNYAVYAYSSSANGAIYAENDGIQSFGKPLYGVQSQTQNATAIAGFVNNNDGSGVYGSAVYGQSGGGGIGVYGVSTGSGYGVFGSSSTGYAGYFAGRVVISNELIVGNTTYTSDRNLKSDFRPIDGKDVLARVGQLPISSWYYNNSPQKRHVGPMAQDFHAVFGLNGADDTHISEVDVSGVSLAAIQELYKQMQIKDSQIAKLTAQVAKFEDQTARFEARMAALERRSVNPTQTADLERSDNPRVALN